MVLTIPIDTFMKWMAFAVAILGVVISMFKLWREFQDLKKSNEDRKGDSLVMFMVLRALLEDELGRHPDNKEPLSTALDNLNAHIEKRAAGVSENKKA